MVDPKSVGICGCISILLVLIAILVGVSVNRVSSTDLGLQYDTLAKTLDGEAKRGGLFLGPVGYRFIKFPATFETVDLNDRTCVSNDGLLVDFSVTFQFQMTTNNIEQAALKYRNNEKWQKVVEEAGLSAVHHACSNFLVAEFQNKRAEIQTKMEENLRLKLEGNPDTGEEGVHAVAKSLQLTYVQLPDKYRDAVSEKQQAEEDIKLAVTERTQQTTQAETKRLEALEEAQKTANKARIDAEVIRTKAELRAEEILFSFEREAEALVEVKEQLNLTTEGVLAYLSNKLLSEASDLTVTVGEPARLSRKDEL